MVAMHGPSNGKMRGHARAKMLFDSPENIECKLSDVPHRTIRVLADGFLSDIELTQRK